MSTTHEMSVPEPLEFKLPHHFTFLELDTSNSAQIEHWRSFSELRADAMRDPNQARLLLDFASQDGPSLTARAFAYDEGVRLVADMVEIKNFRSTEPSMETLQLYDHLRSVIPEYFSGNAMRDRDYGDVSFVYRDHYALFEHIARSEHISFTESDTSQGLDERNGLERAQVATPEATSMLIGHFIDGASKDIDHISPAVARDVLATALKWSAKPFGQVSSEDDQSVAEFAKLWRLTRSGSEAHKASIDAIYQNGKDKYQDYSKVFNNLYNSALGLKAAFPDVLGNTTTNGAHGLLADALFAVDAHLQSKKRTHTSILLNNGAEKPVDFDDDEPLMVLRQLDEAFRKLHKAVTDPNYRTLQATRSKNGFQIDRFIDISTGLPSGVSLYSRPFEADSFDEIFEYGRSGRGVEASDSYIIQVGPSDKLLSLEKQASKDTVISVRLDREHGGTISLDIGSVLGDPTSFGTKVGRLLGWGNSLRAQATGQGSNLNHVKDVLDQRYGEPFEFAALTKQMRDRVERMRPTKLELQHYFSLARRVSASRAGSAVLAGTLAASS